jgi:hypothetical protein
MSEQRTIYCNLGKKDIADVMSQRFDDLSFEGGPEDWSSVTAHVDGGSMTLNALTFQHTNDEYSNLHFKTCMFIWDIDSLEEDEKERLSEAFGHKKLIVGVVVEPDFEADERFMDAVVDIAKQLDGLIFTGTSILDSAGSTIANFS